MMTMTIGMKQLVKMSMINLARAEEQPQQSETASVKMKTTKGQDKDKAQTKTSVEAEQNNAAEASMVNDAVDSWSQAEERRDGAMVSRERVVISHSREYIVIQVPAADEHIRHNIGVQAEEEEDDRECSKKAVRKRKKKTSGRASQAARRRRPSG